VSFLDYFFGPLVNILLTINANLETLIKLQAAHAAKGDREMSDLTAAVEVIRGKVAQVLTVDESAAVLIKEIAQTIRDTPGVTADILALADKLETSSQALGDAVKENTPAAA